MSDYAVVTFLLTITAFYVFLAIYILVRILSSRTLSLANVGDRGRKKALQENSEDQSSRGLW